LSVLEVALREQYSNFTWVLENRRRNTKGTSVTASDPFLGDQRKRPTESDRSRFTLVQMLADAEMLNDFDGYLRANGSIDLLPCYKAIINFQNMSFVSKGAMVSAASTLFTRFFLPGTSISGVVEKDLVDQVQLKLSEGNAYQTMFSEILFDLEWVLEDVWVKLGGKPSKSRTHHATAPNIAAAQSAASKVAVADKEAGKVVEKDKSKRGFKMSFLSNLPRGKK